MAEQTEQNKAQTILKKLKDNQGSLYISRVPPKTKEAFMKLANEEFCGDYGMLLKFLMDDIVGQDMKSVILALENLENRIVQLETAQKEEPPSKKERIKMLNGRTVEKRKVET